MYYIILPSLPCLALPCLTMWSHVERSFPLTFFGFFSSGLFWSVLSLDFSLPPPPHKSKFLFSSILPFLRCALYPFIYLILGLHLIFRSVLVPSYFLFLLSLVTLSSTLFSLSFPFLYSLSLLHCSRSPLLNAYRNGNPHIEGL